MLYCSFAWPPPQCFAVKDKARAKTVISWKIPQNYKISAYKSSCTSTTVPTRGGGQRQLLCHFRK
ncbi:hypothetical protein L484_020443 [Morus notabilis]|uniref:Uncharacterized protein n=1 Tax=Morus notabilis TaxID=981085 RepID=W9SJC6_9ROSA|nr:hypothetical protein L484_020443 [Morus notabilis]